MVIRGIKRYRFLWYWLPILGYCILIFGLSSLSSKTVPITSLSGADKVLHGIEYGILGFLLARSLFRAKARFSNGSLMIFIVVLATFYGISDEIHQVFVPGRTPSILDVLADGLGAMIGVFCYLRVIRNKNQPPLVFP